MVPHKTSLAQHRVQLCKTLTPVQLVCVCHHLSKSSHVEAKTPLPFPEIRISLHCKRKNASDFIIFFIYL